MSEQKELMFFMWNRNWRRGLEWYKRHFVGDAQIYGEASTGYTSYPAHLGVPARIHSVVPDVKLIYLVRDPIDRILADYVQQFSDANEDRPLSEVLADLDGNPISPRSKYYTQIGQYLPYFPKRQLLVIDQRNLWDRRIKTLREVFQFLEVDATFVSPKFSNVKNRTANKRRKGSAARFLKRLAESEPINRIVAPDTRRQLGSVVYSLTSAPIEKPVLDDVLRARLVKYLKDDIDRFRAFCGR